jgi:GNAT superfamily N-acetyltransferase
MQAIRLGTKQDIDAVAEMAEARRLQYERYEPLFWKKAANSLAMSRAFLAHVAGQPENLFLVACEAEQVMGFLIATPVRVPPVFEPGPTAMIDDFCVAEPALWESVGPALLAEARARLRQRGFAQIVVVCGRKDAEKSAALDAADLSLTSTWWTAKA